MADNGKYQDYCLKWDNYYNHLSGAFLHLLESESMVDVTLSAGGEKVRAHKIVLSASSPYFQELLSSAEDAHPTLILSDVDAEDMKAVLQFVYRGELCVMPNRFASVLQVADNLKIRGLGEVSGSLPTLEEMMNTDEMAIIVPSDSDGITLPNDSSNPNNKSTAVVEECAAANEEEHMKECITTAADGVDASPKNASEVIMKEVVKVKEVEGANIPSAERTVIVVDLEGDDHVSSEKEETDPSGEAGPKTNAKKPKSMPRGPYVKKCEGVSEDASRRKLRKQCYKKEYSEESMCEALDELRRGRSLVEAAAAHHIPRSTLYVRARSSGIKFSLTRQEYTEETVISAVQAVRDGSSLQRAAEDFKIPKTVLWRKVQKEIENGSAEYKKLEKSFRAPYTPEQRKAAVDALVRGENLSKVYKEYKIPKTTLFRERNRLVACGQIPKAVPREGALKKMTVNYDRLDLAVAACRKKGMTHALAALTYQVPKTTLWRKLKQLRKEDLKKGLQGNVGGGEVDKMDEEINKEISNPEEGAEEGDKKGVEEVESTLDEHEETEGRTQVEDSVEVVVGNEVTVKEDGTVSFVAADGSTECAEELHLPPGSSLIILTTEEGLQLQEGSQIIVETDDT